MTKLKKIAILPGDGIGKDVMHSAIQIFDALNLPFKVNFGEIGWECWKKEGNPIPENTWKLIKNSDAILLGATTSMPAKEALEALPLHLKEKSPDYISPIIQLRKNLDLYANVRPCFDIRGSANDFNFCIIRENTEGLYSGLDYYPTPSNILMPINQNYKWKDLCNDDVSTSFRIQTREGLARIYEFAFNYAVENGFKRVTLADKPNVLRNSSAFAREVFESISAKYPNIL